MLVAVSVTMVCNNLGPSLTRKVDGAVVVSIHLVNHVLQLRFGRVLAQGTHDGAQLLGGNLT